jgi:hypothetical protein
MDFFDLTTGMLTPSHAVSKMIVDQSIYALSQSGGDDLDLNVPDALWEYMPEKHRSSIKLWIRALAFVVPLLKAYENTRASGIRELVSDIISSFLKYMESKTERQFYASEDHAMYVRTVVLLKSMQLFPENEEQNDAIREFLAVQGEWMYDDRAYSRNNHGAMQDYGLLYLSVFFGGETGKKYEDKAFVRLRALVDECFDEEGFCNENTVGYWLYNIRLYSAIIAFCGHYGMEHETINRIADGVRRAESALRYVVYPSGGIPNIGDSGVFEAANLPSINTTRLFKRANFLISKNSDFYLSFKCGFTSSAHKQADETSVTLRVGGRDIFVDSGLYNYDRNDPIEQYVRSSRGHSAVFPEIVDNMSIRKYLSQCEAARIEHCTIDGDDFYAGAHYRLSQDKISVRRKITRHGTSLILSDSWDNLIPQDMRVRFALHPDCCAVISEICETYTRIDVSNGDVKARLYVFGTSDAFSVETQSGYYSAKANVAVKNPVLDICVRATVCGRVHTFVTFDDGPLFDVCPLEMTTHAGEMLKCVLGDVTEDLRFKGDDVSLMRCYAYTQSDFPRDIVNAFALLHISALFDKYAFAGDFRKTSFDILEEAFCDEAGSVPLPDFIRAVGFAQVMEDFCADHGMVLPHTCQSRIDALRESRVQFLSHPITQYSPAETSDEFTLAKSNPDADGNVFAEGKFGAKCSCSLDRDTLSVSVRCDTGIEDKDFAFYLYRNGSEQPLRVGYQAKHRWDFKLTLSGDYYVRVFIKRKGTTYKNADVFDSKVFSYCIHTVTANIVQDARESGTPDV